MLVELAAGDINVAIVDNAPHLDRDDHRAGYNGLAWLTHTARPTNLFVPLYAGLNLELYFDGATDERDTLFEPRRAPMVLSQLDTMSAELHQPPTPYWRVESWTRFTLRPPHSVDFCFRAIPRAKTFKQGWMGVFWASYIDHPEDLGLNLIARDRDGSTRWVRHTSPQHGVESTHLHARDRFEVRTVHDQTKYMFASLSPWRYARPFYYGTSHGMMYLWMVDDDPRLRFTQSPSGGGQGCPAWDYQLVVPDYRVDEEYSFRGRLVYKPFAGQAECEREYDAWQRERDSGGA